MPESVDEFMNQVINEFYRLTENMFIATTKIIS